MPPLLPSAILLPLCPYTLKATTGKAECGGYGEQRCTQDSQGQRRRDTKRWKEQRMHGTYNEQACPAQNEDARSRAKPQEQERKRLTSENESREQIVLTEAQPVHRLQQQQ